MQTLIILFMRGRKYWKMFIKSSQRHRCYAKSIVPIGATCLFHLLYIANDNLWPSASCIFFSTLRPRSNLGRKRCHGLFSLKHDPWNRIWSKESLTNPEILLYPISSMYGIFTHIWLIFMVNVGKYTSPMGGMGYSYKRNFRSSWPASRVGFMLLGIEKWCFPQHKSTYGSFLQYV